jgi:hypothetical protein
VEQELPTGLSERQIPELVEDDEVHTGQVIGEPTTPGAGIWLQRCWAMNPPLARSRPSVWLIGMHDALGCFDMNGGTVRLNCLAIVLTKNEISARRLKQRHWLFIGGVP